MYWGHLMKVSAALVSKKGNQNVGSGRRPRTMIAVIVQWNDSIIGFIPSWVTEFSGKKWR